MIDYEVLYTYILKMAIYTIYALTNMIIHDSYYNVIYPGYFEN